MVILIDGGNTHNFMQDHLVRSSSLSAILTSPLWVMVGNGSEIEWWQICEGVTVLVQNQTFTIDFHVLSLCGADMVLGVQWLKSLGPMLTDYTELTMKFIHDGRIIELRGDRDVSLHLITLSQLRRLVETEETSAFFHIQVLPPELSSTKTPL